MSSWKRIVSWDTDNLVWISFGDKWCVAPKPFYHTPIEKINYIWSVVLKDLGIELKEEQIGKIIHLFYEDRIEISIPDSTSENQMKLF